MWYAGSWCNWLGHSGAVDAGLACARRLGAQRLLLADDAREVHASWRPCVIALVEPRVDASPARYLGPRRLR